MTDLSNAAAAAKNLAADAATAATGAVKGAETEATTIWAKAVRLFNRFWPVGAGVGAGYVLGALHALGRVF